MKKILVFTLLLAYTTFASGVNLKLHYCKGKLKSISFFGKDNDCCKSKTKKKKCCDNKTTFFKVKDKHSSNPTLTFVTSKLKSSQAVFILHNFYWFSFINSSCTTSYQAPPVVYNNPLYIKNRVLII